MNFWRRAQLGSKALVPSNSRNRKKNLEKEENPIGALEAIGRPLALSACLEL